ncbi:transcription antitermination factor NusB [Paramagnetospirillum kuznetsovii]|uniref:Transcription antitermination protein NusB n=1 Tax=Paramagnetospirillum kuznetsovii TaxID=2053833 RepID=A0A364NZL2_9PROT|nr:transcription antitermination factor NusB [Paramagnetospirillum kuznetsovii]RAU22514.1 transcription antitermination factor NusB [Paramagnetospirillum kuznetsovii]
MNTNPSVARRSAARLAAIQALYQMEMTGVSDEQALLDSKARRTEEPRGRMAEPDSSLLGQIVRGVSGDTARLDRPIGEALTGDWSVERLEAILRAIMRAGAWELLARPQTPTRVCISEWVDVAHAFYSGPEPGLVNAVLDRLAQMLRPEASGKGE